MNFGEALFISNHFIICGLNSDVSSNLLSGRIPAELGLIATLQELCEFLVFNDEMLFHDFHLCCCVFWDSIPIQDNVIEQLHRISPNHLSRYDFQFSVSNQLLPIVHLCSRVFEVVLT